MYTKEKENHYINETRVKGKTKFLINSNPENVANTQKIDTPEVSKPTATVIRKGCKTITRMEIPDFCIWQENLSHC